MLHQIANGKVGRIALAVVSEFLARLKRGDVRHRKLLAAIAAALKDGADQVLVFPGQAAEQDRHLAALIGGKGAFDRPMEMCGLVASCNLPQAGALYLQALVDPRVY